MNSTMLPEGKASDVLNCGGKCVIELQKKLDSQVITEFFEVVRDFHNDNKTANELKDVIVSESNECIELLKQKTADLCAMVDELFLHRRNRQSSFYRLCHKLARKGCPEGVCLPDESKCICFSEENLKRFNVDPAAKTSIKYDSNINLAKDAIHQLYGELECTKCRHSSQYRFRYNLACDCHPSISAQHELHEAILDCCGEKDSKTRNDSWYLTHLKRDAEYYRSRSTKSPIPSDESVESFEVISSEGSKPMKEAVIDNEDVNCKADGIGEGCRNPIHPLGTDIKKLRMRVMASKCDFLQNWLSSDMSDAESSTGYLNCYERNTVSPLILSSKSCGLFKHSLLTTGDTSPIKYNPKKLSTSPHNITEKFCSDSSDMFNSPHKSINKTTKSTPADIVKQSFTCYMQNANNEDSTRFLSNSYSKAKSFAGSVIVDSLNEAGTVLKSVQSNVNQCSNKANSEIRKTTPSDILQFALNPYLNKENNKMWLRQ